MFAARGLLVSLAFFAVVYCLLSMLAVLVWRGVTWGAVGREKHAARSASLLFGLRIFSFAVSSVVSMFFTFPSFWMMERPSLDEDAGTFVLAACAFVIVGAGAFRFLRDQARTTRAVAQWGLGARAESSAESPSLAPNVRARTWGKGAVGAPALILVGIRKPLVMVSDAAATVLSEDELQVAIRHELGHRRSWDNLKKVLISATPFPGMGSLEKAWRQAAELAADDAAVATRQDALDLAAALIKLSRSSKQLTEPALASGLVCGSSSIAVRVERLLEWRAGGHRLRRTWPWTVPVLLMMSVTVAGHYGAALALTHRLTELLVP